MSQKLKECLSKPIEKGIHSGGSDYACPLCNRELTITVPLEYSFCLNCNVRIGK